MHLHITEEAARNVMEALRVESATGPDQLPALILKKMAEPLARPVSMLLQRIVASGQWPDCWRAHWIIPRHKREAVCYAKNYRGVHLTDQISKVSERLLGSHLQSHAEAMGMFGPNQFAYRKGLGSRDALAFMTTKWIWAFEQQKKVAVFCSDVQGAFDRVRATRLIQKLQASGLPQGLVQVLASWLRDRRSNVIVEGTNSDQRPLRDMVFQGTVLGPPLWNLFFADARLAIEDAGFEEIVYADDLNAFKEVDKETSNVDARAMSEECQKLLHEWGDANSVSFDPGKESIHVLGRHDPDGEDFKILGVKFDCKLIMAACIDTLAAEAGWKLQAVIRAGRFHTVDEMAVLYKSKLLSFLEYRTSAIYHACDSHLRKVDALQARFLKHLGISAREAFERLNLAPLSTRRDIAMLGVIHRSVLGLGPPQLASFSCDVKLGSSHARASMCADIVFN